MFSKRFYVKKKKKKTSSNGSFSNYVLSSTVNLGRETLDTERDPQLDK